MPPKDVGVVTMEYIANFIEKQADLKRFFMRDRVKFWSEIKWKPGGTSREHAARIRQYATTIV